MGGGHVMRCLALANTLKTQGGQSIFLAAQITDTLADRIVQAGHQLKMLHSEAETQIEPRSMPHDAPAHAAWLETDWRQDAQNTLRTLDDIRPDWLVVDHYALDRQWHGLLRPQLKNAGQGIMVIDDLGDRDLDCDVLLDPNFRQAGDDPFIGRVPLHCQRFVGAQMALLDPAYAQAHRDARLREDLAHILIYLGATPALYLIRLLDALQKMSGVSAELVSSPDIICDPRLSGHLAVQTGQVTLHGPYPSLIPAMQRADLAIGPIGSSTWERMCLGLPTIAVTLAANQEVIAQHLHDAELIDLLGRVEEVDMPAYVAALERIAQPGRLAGLSKSCFAICDGLGTHRLAEHLVATLPVE